MRHLRSLLSLGAVNERNDDECELDYTSKSSRLSMNNKNKRRFRNYLNANVRQSSSSDSPQLPFDNDCSSSTNSNNCSISPRSNVHIINRRLSSSVSSKLVGHKNKSKRQFFYHKEKSKLKSSNMPCVSTCMPTIKKTNGLSFIVESPAFTSSFPEFNIEQKNQSPELSMIHATQSTDEKYAEEKYEKVECSTFPLNQLSSQNINLSQILAAPNLHKLSFVDGEQSLPTDIQISETMPALVRPLSDESEQLPYSSYSSPTSILKSTSQTLSSDTKSNKTRTPSFSRNQSSSSKKRNPPLQKELPAPIKPHPSHPMFTHVSENKHSFLPPPLRPIIPTAVTVVVHKVIVDEYKEEYIDDDDDDEQLPNIMPQMLQIDKESNSATHSSSSRKFTINRSRSNNSRISNSDISLSPYSPTALMFPRTATNDSNWSDSKKSDIEPFPHQIEQPFTVEIQEPQTNSRDCRQDFDEQLQASIKLLNDDRSNDQFVIQSSYENSDRSLSASPMPYKMFDDNESAFYFDDTESAYNFDEDIAQGKDMLAPEGEMPECKPKLGTIRSTSSYVGTAYPSFLKIDDITNYLSPFSDFTTSTAKSRYSAISYPSTRTSAITNLSSYIASSTDSPLSFDLNHCSSFDIECSSNNSSCRGKQIRYRMFGDTKNNEQNPLPETEEFCKPLYPENIDIYVDCETTLPFISNLAPLIMTPTPAFEDIATPIVIENISPEEDFMFGMTNEMIYESVDNFENNHSLSLNEMNLGLGFSTSDIQISDDFYQISIEQPLTNDNSLMIDCESVDTPSTIYISGGTTPRLKVMDDMDRQCIKRIYQPFPEEMYEFMNNLGKGAFGIVQKLFHLQSCKVVAVKRSLCMDEMYIKQFKNEVRICTEFADCHQILSIIDCGCDSSNHICIALEYMDIGSLDNILFYSTNEIRHIAKQVLIALQELHSKLYIHNDIKPDNILINTDGDVKLSDFGCVQHMISIDHPFTHPIGPLRYQSFEKKMVTPIRYGIASDIYSFGVTIAEIFASQKCNNDDERNENISITYQGPALSRERFENESEFLIAEDFLLHCLEKDQKLRWTADQLLQHPFLASIQNESNIQFGMRTSVTHEHKKSTDLQFMIDRLSRYYLEYIDRHINEDIRISIKSSNCCINDDIRLSPYPQSNMIIDQLFTDEERVANIADHCNYSVNEVTHAIQSTVASIKDKYLQQ